MKKILLVEDDQEISKMYCRAFEFAGYEVECTYDGEEALEKLSTMNPLPSVIIMDIIIPKLSGLDLLRKIKGDSKFQNIPVAMLTNSFLKENADRFISLGADMYLVKMEHQAKDVVQKIDELVAKYSPK